MTELNLSEKFPDLEPISKAPSLWLINGCGLTVYGSRDHDAETNSYIKTHCLAFLFVPILALGAYRVVKAGGGTWAFIGRDRLSALAKAWNVAITVFLGGGITYGVWNAKYNSPNAVADRQIAKAGTLIQDGDIVAAAQAYQEVTHGKSDRINSARQSLVTMHEQPEVSGAELSQIAEVMEIELAARLETTGDPVGKSVSETGMNMIQQRGQQDPPGASQIVKVIQPVVQDFDRFNNVRLPVLEKLVDLDPTNLDSTSSLAQALESLGELERCETLLAPHADQLGNTEGARILGQIWAGQGKVDEAHQLLDSYCQPRLPKLTAAEAKLRRIMESAQTKILSDLNDGKAPQSFYSQYDRANEERQFEMVDDYLNKKMESDWRLVEARQDFSQQTDVVPVALDLGMVKLRRAQAMDDAQNRQSELESAEDTFLSIRAVAGDSDEYRLYMGQVNYWLGKYEEGKNQFDLLLDANQRDFNILIAVSGMVREVGRSVDARKLAEEAYENADEASEKHHAATIISSMMHDNDDRIMWLERADQKDPTVRASLLSAKGAKAYGEDDAQLAEKLLRQSIAAYDETPENVSVLNNSGLTCFSLYRVTGDQADFDEGLRRIEKAISLQPADSILRYNASHILLTAAYGDVIGDAINVKLARSDASSNMLRYLYSDWNDKQIAIKKLDNHDAIKKAIDLLQNVLLLAPKNRDAYSELQTVLEFGRKTNKLSELRDRIIAAEPEIEVDELKKFVSGADDKKYIESLTNAIDSNNTALGTAKPGSVTRAVLIGELVQYHSQLHMLQPVDRIDELVTLAREAYEATPSSGTRGALISALGLRAHQRLAANNPDYQAHAKRGGRGVSHVTSLASFIAQSESQSKAAHADADVAATSKLIRASVAAFPDNPSPWNWAWFRHHDPTFAVDLAAKTRENEFGRVSLEIGDLLSPASSEQAIDSCFLHLSQGDLPAAKASLQRAVDYEMPLPIAPAELR